MDSDNPYEPPKAVPSQKPRVILRPDRMPGTVIAALVLVTLIIVSHLANTFLAADGTGDGGDGSLMPLIISSGIIVGSLMRHPIAWHVSRGIASLVVVFGGLGLVLGLITAFSGEELLIITTLVLAVALNVAILWLMSTASARAWFGLGCPSCGNLRPFAAKFGHSLARCRECGTLWEPRTGMLKAG